MSLMYGLKNRNSWEIRDRGKRRDWWWKMIGGRDKRDEVGETGRWQGVRVVRCGLCPET